MQNIGLIFAFVLSIFLILFGAGAVFFYSLAAYNQHEITWPGLGGGLASLVVGVWLLRFYKTHAGKSWLDVLGDAIFWA